MVSSCIKNKVIYSFLGNRELLTIILCLVIIQIDGVTVKCNQENMEIKVNNCKCLMQSLYYDDFDLTLPRKSASLSNCIQI